MAESGLQHRTAERADLISKDEWYGLIAGFVPTTFYVYVVDFK
jgi:hypothetical protein